MESPHRFFTSKEGYRWYILGTVLVGAFMSALDASIMNIALPTLHDTFHERMVVVEWVSLSYLLTLTLLLPVWGRLADIFGRKPLYNLGFVVFIIGSGLCGAAGSVRSLIIWRVLQAVGAALLQSNSIALITQAFPDKERGRAIGIQGAVQAAAMSFGPFLGGILIHWISWRAIFYINLPIGLVGTVMAWFILPKPSPQKGERNLDYAGALTFSIALTALMLVLTQMTAHNWVSAHETTMLFATLIFAIAFFVIEKKHKSPFIELNLFKEQTFTIGNISGMLSYVVLFAPMFLMPFYLENVLRYDPQKAGLFLTPVPIALSVTALFSGYMSDKFGDRIFTIGGMLLAALSLYSFTSLQPDSSYVAVAWRLALMGISLGLFTPPNNSAVMGAAPETHLSVAGGLLNMMRSLGMMGGVAISATIYSKHMDKLLSAVTPATQALAPAARHIQAMVQSGAHFPGKCSI